MKETVSMPSLSLEVLPIDSFGSPTDQPPLAFQLTCSVTLSPSGVVMFSTASGATETTSSIAMAMIAELPDFLNLFLRLSKNDFIRVLLMPCNKVYGNELLY